MKRILITFLILASIVLTQTGCDKMKKAIDATGRLAAQVNNLQIQVEKSYDDGLIDKATALKLTHIVKDELNPAVGTYTDFVEKLAKAYPPGTAPKAADWATLRALFQAVEAAFQKVLVAVGALSTEKSALITLAIDTLVEIVDSIHGFFAASEPYMKEANIYA